MKRVFITGAGGDVGAGIIRCLSMEDMEMELYGCDIKSVVPSLNRFKTFYVVPRYDSAFYWPAISTILLEENITDFWPTSEEEIAIADKNRSFFAENGIHLLINTPLIVNTLTSKYETSVFLQKHGFHTPETQRGSMSANMDFPLIVKPDYGRGSMQLHIVNDQGQLKKALDAVPHGVVQQYIGTPEEEYTMGVFSDGETTRSLAFRRTLGNGAMSVYVEAVQDPELDDIALRCAKAFDLYGAFNIQMRKQNGKYYIFEINPRISSTVVFRHLLGFKDAVWWLQLMHGELVDFSCPPIAEGVVGVKTFGEEIFCPPFPRRFVEE